MLQLDAVTDELVIMFVGVGPIRSGALALKRFLVMKTRDGMFRNIDYSTKKYFGLSDDRWIDGSGLEPPLFLDDEKSFRF